MFTAVHGCFSPGHFTVTFLSFCVPNLNKCACLHPLKVVDCSVIFVQFSAQTLVKVTRSQAIVVQPCIKRLFFLFANYAEHA